VLAVGDEAFQRKCLRRIGEQIAKGTTLVLVSHAPASIERVCDRVIVFDAGRVDFDGPTAEGLQHYHRALGVEHGAGETERSVVIGDVDLYDGDGRRRAVFAPGEELRVAIDLTAPATVELELRHAGGERLFATRERFEQAGRVTFTVPALHLLGGDYDLVVGDRMVGFSVADTPGAEGIVDLRGTWAAAEPVAP
jgi:hypothetical protein